MFGKFCQENKIVHQPLTRESPFLNIVERYHAELKKVSKTTSVNLEVAAGIVNSYPFSKTPKGCRNISPEILLFGNDIELIRLICDFLEKQSEYRRTRSEKLRGQNISRFSRVFKLGDLVKFNLQNGTIGFGKIVEKHKDKMYKIERIDGTGHTEIHSYQLELVTISEKFLKKLLENPQ